jgi:hypothetical protein
MFDFIKVEFPAVRSLLKDISRVQAWLFLFLFYHEFLKKKPCQHLVVDRAFRFDFDGNYGLTMERI